MCGRSGQHYGTSGIDAAVGACPVLTCSSMPLPSSVPPSLRALLFVPINSRLSNPHRVKHLPLQMRSSGKAAPKRLTTHQRQIVGRLLAAHGDDVAAMLKDRKLNSMQHSEGVLRALIESYRYWKEGSGVDFRVPHKRLW